MSFTGDQDPQPLDMDPTVHKVELRSFAKHCISLTDPTDPKMVAHMHALASFALHKELLQAMVDAGVDRHSETYLHAYQEATRSMQRLQRLRSHLNNVNTSQPMH